MSDNHDISILNSLIKTTLDSVKPPRTQTRAASLPCSASLQLNVAVLPASFRMRCGGLAGTPRTTAACWLLHIAPS